MNVAGLFAGIGGFELGLHQAGHRARLLCEIKAEAVNVLATHFSGTTIASDIVRLRSLPREIELIAAGFPCQDLSQAGRTGGVFGQHSTLVHEVFRLLESRRVPWLILENVPFMLHLQHGFAMRRIIAELERLDYRWAYRVVDTFSFGLPQRRERVFLVASRTGHPEDVLLADDQPIERPKTELGKFAHGFYWTEGNTGLGWAVDSVPTIKNGSTIGIASPPGILMPSGQIIKPDIRDAERMQGFEPNWTRPAEATARASRRWSLVGSAVSVPVSRWLGTRLNDPGEFDPARCVDFPRNGGLPRAACGDRSGRCAVSISTDPIGVRPPHLANFLQFEGAPLSEKATSGFYRRANQAKLRFAEGFLDAVRTHRDLMSSLQRGPPPALAIRS